jgi:hypothetical protein
LGIDGDRPFSLIPSQKLFFNKKINGAVPTGGREKNVSFVWRPVMAALYISASWFCYFFSLFLDFLSSSLLASHPLTSEINYPSSPIIRYNF